MQLEVLLFKVAITYSRKSAIMYLYYAYSNAFCKHRIIFDIEFRQLIIANIPDSGTNPIGSHFVQHKIAIA
jgi:hypothetical protein